MKNKSDISLRHWVRPEDIPVDSGPVNLIPAGGEPIKGADFSLHGDASEVVYGYFKDGIYHIQSIEEFED